MQTTSETQIDTANEQLKYLETLLNNIEQSKVDDIDFTKEIQVYDELNANLNAKQKSEELLIFAEQTKVIKQILQHPKCPQNLKFKIMLTNNHGSDALLSGRIRTPLEPIFEALTSGKCTALGLEIKLEGTANHVLPSEMKILVKGLTEGKCPHNLHITFGPLDIAPVEPDTCRATNAWNLLDALKSPNCPSGLNIEYKVLDNDPRVDGKSREKYEELKRLCTNGNYDRINIKQKINHINDAIQKELSTELERLGEKDNARKEALTELLNSIIAICNKEMELIENCNPNRTWIWKKILQENLEKIIRQHIKTSKLDKKYTSLEKFGKNLLNLITGMLFPLAMIKYAATGSAFYSTVGKTHEAVEKALNISKKM